MFNDIELELEQLRKFKAEHESARAPIAEQPVELTSLIASTIYHALSHEPVISKACDAVLLNGAEERGVIREAIYAVKDDLAAAVVAKLPKRESGTLHYRLALALDGLVNLKRYKDQKGKDAYYAQQQPLAWGKAQRALAEYGALSEIEGQGAE